MRDERVSVLIRNWGTVALRGAAALLFGLFTIVNPAVSLRVLILLFGAFVVVDGVLTIMSAVASRHGERYWVVVLSSGILTVAIGGLTFFMPRVTALVLLYLIAGWAIVVGVAQIIAAVRLRKVIVGEWLLGLVGVLSVLFGVALIVFPRAGALAVVAWIGVYATVIGMLLIALALRLRRWGRAHGSEEALRPA